MFFDHYHLLLFQLFVALGRRIYWGIILEVSFECVSYNTPKPICMSLKVTATVTNITWHIRRSAMRVSTSRRHLTQNIMTFIFPRRFATKTFDVALSMLHRVTLRRGNDDFTGNLEAQSGHLLHCPTGHTFTQPTMPMVFRVRPKVSIKTKDKWRNRVLKVSCRLL